MNADSYNDLTPEEQSELRAYITDTFLLAFISFNIRLKRLFKLKK